MIDELDFAFEEQPDRRARHRRGAHTKAQQRKKKRGSSGRGKTWLAAFLVLFLLGGLGAAGWYGYDRLRGYLDAPDYNSAGTGEVQIEIKPGETLTEVAQTLHAAGVVKSPKAFVEASDADPRSRNIEPGNWRVRKQMRASDALAMLLDPKNKVVSKVTVPEGRSAIQTYKLLSEKTGLKYDDFVAAGKDPIALGVPDFWFTRRDGKPVTKSIEGFLFPATYEFNPKMNAQQILKGMVLKFLNVTTEMNFVERVQKERGGIAPYEALIVGSLAQAEAGVPEDIGKIARVAYNRIYVKDMPLQFDVTINYSLELAGRPTKSSKDLTASEINDASNPYNTHQNKGLPPTPINSPGNTALEGAMNPPAGGWLFFVAVDKEGHSKFAVTDAEHEANKRLACQNGILC